jgi:PBSX family phage terminase large subunit
MPDPVGLSPAQLASVRESVGAVNIWEGSISSGKTIGSLLRWLIFVAHAPTTGDLAMIGRTRDSIARNALTPLQNPELFGDLAGQTRYTRSSGMARILGRDVEVIGANDAKAEPKIRGFSGAGFYVDEITTLPDPFFAQVLGRMRVPGSRLFGTTNPDSPAHWFKKKYLDQLDPDWRRFHFTMDDNPALEQSYKDRMHRQMTGLWRRRFIDGEWVAAEGAVFDMWDPAVHVIPWREVPPLVRMLGIGLDYGTTNPTAALALGMARDGSLYLVDEWRHDPEVTGVRWADVQQSAALKTWATVKHTDLPVEPPMERTFIDPTAASLKMQLYDDGYEGLIDADNSVAYGIRTMASLLSSGRLHVADRCEGFIAEVPGYCWDDKATLKGVDAPIKVADHSLDAARYVILSTEPIWRDAMVDPIALAVLRHQLEDATPDQIDFMRVPM